MQTEELSIISSGPFFCQSFAAHDGVPIDILHIAGKYQIIRACIILILTFGSVSFYQRKCFQHVFVGKFRKNVEKSRTTSKLGGEKVMVGFSGGLSSRFL